MLLVSARELNGTQNMEHRTWNTEHGHGHGTQNRASAHLDAFTEQMRDGRAWHHRSAENESSEQHATSQASVAIDALLGGSHTE